MIYFRRSWIAVLVTLLWGCAVEESSVEQGEAALASYVGDESCAGCHEEIYISYHETGMGRSVSLFDAENAPERFASDIEIYNKRFDYYYAPFVRGDTLFQKEYRRDRAGKIIHERTYPVEWVIGSGNATRSYLMNVNGHITEMPLTWYADKQTWDMSPGYTQQNFRFERAIGQECMTCHNGLPAYSAYTQNHFADVPLGISCERCHGPGSKHEDIQLAGLGPEEGEIDETIVNPEHLDRALQLSICQQCHLTGTTVFDAGENMATYRPGTSLDQHRSVFVIEEQLNDPESFGIASHAERLARSACFQQSEMTCITCHDPHRPVAALEEEYFNQACVSCHTPADPIVCSRDDIETREDVMTGNCVGCHIQKSGTSDIPHVTFTDHWIRKELPPARAPESIERELVRSTPFKLVRVASDAPVDDPQAKLEEAIAYFKFYDTEHRLPTYLPQITRETRNALVAGAEHAEGRLTLARALIEMDSLRSAETVLTDAIQKYPDHARLQYWLGEVRHLQQRSSEAIPSLRRALEIAPHFLEARLKLASAYSATGRPGEAEAELLQLLDENPMHLPEAWNNLGFIYLQSQRLEKALEMFEQAISLDPDMDTAWANAGSALLMQQQFDRAAEKFERALEVNAGLVSALGNLSLIYRQQAKITEARELLRRLLAIQPNDPNAMALLRELEGM